MQSEIPPPEQVSHVGWHFETITLIFLTAQKSTLLPISNSRDVSELVIVNSAE